MELHIDGAVIVLAGQVDVRSISTLRDHLYDQLAQHPHEDVVLDVSGVESVDVVVLRMIAVAGRFAVREGHRLTLRDCSPAVRRMLALSHLRGLVEVEPHTAASA